MKITKFFMMAVMIFTAYACSESHEEGLTDLQIQEKIAQDLDFYRLLRLTDEVVFLKRSEFSENEIRESDAFKEASKLISTLEERYINFEKNGLVLIQSKNLNEDLLAISNNINSKTEIDDYCGCEDLASETSAASCLTGCNYSYIYCMQSGGASCGGMQQDCSNQCCNNFCPAAP